MKQSGWGIASLVLGVLSILLSCAGIGAFIGTIGVIFAIIAFTKKNSKYGLAISGIVCSFLGIGIFVVSLGFYDGKNEADNVTEYATEISQPTENKEEKTDIEKPYVIWKEKNCIIKAISCDNNSAKLKIVNKSKKDYDFNIHAMAINGIMTGCNIYTSDTSVPSGKKAMMEIDFEKNWIGKGKNIEYVDFLIWAYDNAESMKDFDTGIIRIKTNKYEKDKKNKAKDGSTEEKGISIFKNNITNSDISYSMINNNNYLVETTLENCSINGWAFEPGYSFSESSDSLTASLDGSGVIIFPNCLANVTVDISDFMEENNMEKVKDFEFSLDVLPEEDYYKETHTKKIVFKN